MDWQPKEFTPGTMWDGSMGYEGWQAYADPYYGAYVEDWAASQTQEITPPRFMKGRGATLGADGTPPRT